MNDPTTPPLQRAIIYIDGDGWMLDHSTDPCAADVRSLFGTDVLPMPFLRCIRESQVRDVLERLNPGVIITRGTDR